MSEFVRARCVATGNEKSIPAAWLVSEADCWEVVEKPATRADGTPLPDKPAKPLESLSSKPTTSGQKATNTKES